LAFPGAPTSQTDECVDDVVPLVAFEADAVIVVLLFWFNSGDADDVAVKMDRVAKTVITAAATMIRLKVTVFLVLN